MLLKKNLTLAILSLFLTIALTPKWANNVLAQPSPTVNFPLQQSVPDGTNVRIDTTDSMKAIAETLEGGFEQQYSGSAVELNAQQADLAIKNLSEGKSDLAAIGRPLTQEEKAQGLTQVPVARHKIAMIVGTTNPYNGSLTIEQFAKIFRGEIRNWSEVGGSAGSIRFIDRPEISDTRRAFPTYPVFQQAPFEVGANAEKVAEDNTDSVIAQLGNDGISYAIYDQVANNPQVKILRMHETLPDDQRYPFSQPLYFIYKGSPSPQVQAFLGYATAAENQQAIEEARSGALAPVPQASPTETALVTEPTETKTEFPNWLGWLLLPLLGALLWLWGKNRKVAPEPIVAAPPVPLAPVAPPIPPSRLVLTPRNCREAYAYWEVPKEQKAQLKQQGGQKLVLRLYDVTDIDINSQKPHTIKQYDCREDQQDLHVPIAVDGRDYNAELGYITDNGNWLSIARSLPVRVPNCPALEPVVPVVGTGIAAAAGAAALSSVVSKATADEPLDRIILTPRNCREAYAYWEVSEQHKASMRQQGGQQLVLRVYEVTGMDLDREPAHSIQQYECQESDRDRHIPIPIDDRDYIAELGYLTQDNRWLSLIRSLHVRVPACVPQSKPHSVSEEFSLLSKKLQPVTLARTEQQQNRIILVPRNAQDAYVYWEVSEQDKMALRQQGNEQFALRLYDMTDSNSDGEPDSIWEFDCDELEEDKHINIYRQDRTYIAELGYRTQEGRWLPLTKSNPVYIAPEDVTVKENITYE